MCVCVCVILLYLLAQEVQRDHFHPTSDQRQTTRLRRRGNQTPPTAPLYYSRLQQ